MTAGPARPIPEEGADREPTWVRQVWDLEVALDEIVAGLQRAEFPRRAPQRTGPGRITSPAGPVLHREPNLERLAGRVPSDMENSALDPTRGRCGRDRELLASPAGSRPGMLLVEDSVISPGVAVTGSSGATRGVVTEQVHDLVDDLIEQVILRGGQLALVRAGDLESHARVALMSRAHRP